MTVTFSQAAFFPDVRVLEYSGLDPTAPLDVTAGAAGTSTSANSGSATTTSANELVFGAGTTGGTFGTVGTGFVTRIFTPNSDIAIDKTVNSTGSYNATSALPYSSTWVMQMATFRASGQGGGGNPAPTVTGISPTSGTTAGGTPVTVSGTGFLAGATLSLGGTAASNVVVSNSTTITATTPAHAAGAVTVTVTNTDAQSGSLNNGYTYSSGGGGGGSIGFVQVNSATPVNNASPVAVAYPLAQTAGNLNIVVVGWNDTTATVSSVVDSRGNTYTLAVGPTSGTALRQSIYYAKNIAGGSNTVTVTFSQAAFFPDVRVLEYRGLDPTAPLDVTAGAAGTSTSANSGSATTTSANELVFGAGTTGGTFGTVGTGFVTRIFTPNSDIAIDKTVNSTGSYNATSALPYSSTWVMQMATFRASP